MSQDSMSQNSEQPEESRQQAPAAGRSADMQSATDRNLAKMSPDDALPPIEPPSAAFIVKLFIVPGAIVVIVLSVVLGFNWITRSGGNAESYVAAIERGAPNSWQCANDLAILLRQDDRLQVDANLASRLSNLVIMHIQKGPPRGDEKKQRINEAGLRVYLCKALGHFAIPEALPGLLQAVSRDHDRNSEEFSVRVSALEAMASLIVNARKIGKIEPLLSGDQLVKALLGASKDTGRCSYANDEDMEEKPRSPRRRGEIIRVRAATALGVIGDQDAFSRLEEMLSDLCADVRYNAALGFARHGNVKCLTVMAKMLDPDEIGGLVDERSDGAKRKKTFWIRDSGLTSALVLLAKANPQADLSKLHGPLVKLEKLTDLHPALRNKVRELLELLQKRSPTP